MSALRASAGAVAIPVLVGAMLQTPSATELDASARARFLRMADVVADRPVGKGVTGSRRLTLRDGTLTHDAHFQTVDIRRPRVTINGRTELRFVDSYHFNIAAYRLATLLGLDGMVPVTVERVWQGRRGALSWWIDAAWDEASRVEAGVRPDDVARWTRQLADMQIFGQLLHDTDRNHGNMLYTASWDLWLIDFTRAFRPWRTLRDPQSVQHCARRLFVRLRRLTLADVRQAVGDHLTAIETDALLARRDAIVTRLETLVALRGEPRVLL